MKYTFDTEFLANGKTIELISIGLINYDTKESIYLVSNEFDYLKACNDKWIYDHVIKNLNASEKHSNPDIKNKVMDFLGTDKNPQFYLYCGAYDWVVFAQLFGDMVNFPSYFPYWFFEIKQDLYRLGYTKDMLPKQESVEHNALNDALHNVVLMDLCFDKLKIIPMGSLVEAKEIETTIGVPVIQKIKSNNFRHTRDA